MFKSFSLFKSLLQSPTAIVLAIGLSTAATTLMIRQHVGFEMIELQAYDRLVRWKTSLGHDDRLLMVEISESDLQFLKQVTPSDEILANALNRIQKYGPRVVGIDLYRDLPQGKGKAALNQALKHPNIIGIYRLGNNGGIAIDPPQSLSEDRTGFNDVLIDRDGVVRRTLLFADTRFSFPLQIALKSLEKDGIEPTESKAYPGVMVLGKTTFLPLGEKSGAYHNLDAAGHQLLLNYRAKNIARRVNLADVLNDRVSEAWIKDKIVLIGNTAISGKDFFYTPYTAHQEQNHMMAGVDIHAQAISQILNGATIGNALIQDTPEWMEWSGIILVALMSSGLTLFIKNPFRLGLSNATCLALMGIASYAAFNYGLWIPIAAPLTAAIVSQGVTLLVRTQNAQRQNRIVMTLLGQNTSKEIAEALWENRHGLIQSGKLPGQSLTATMMFTDLQGFSTISEKLSPEALMAWLNEYLSEVTDLIQAHHGIVNKFTGDGVFAVFGVPVARTTEEEIARDAQDAVDCAIAFDAALGKLNQTWGDRGLSKVRMRVGICTGKVVVGSLGGKNRMEYGVIGDAVNTASRLESCAKDRQMDDCRILVSESTARYLPIDRFPSEAWGAMALKGKQDTVEVFRITASIPSATLRVTRKAPFPSP
jgi:adenylate cyclase